MSTTGLTTARQIIDAARVRHWAFSALALGDGAALLFLRSRVATHVAAHGALLEGLVSTTMSYSVPLTPPPFLVTSTGAFLGTTIGQQLAAVATQGQLVVGTTYQDGWPVHVTLAGVPYIDLTEPPLAADPFGLYGGTPGFPLPADLIRLVSVSLTLSGGTPIPCDVIPESQRFTTLPGRNPAAFVAGNRLVPVLSTVPGSGVSLSGTRWGQVSVLQMSYVGPQGLRTLDDVVLLPSVLTEALVADLALLFAMQAKEMPAADKPGFRVEAERSAAAIGTAALDMLNEPMVTSVHFTG